MLQCSSAGSPPPTNISNTLVKSTRLLPHLQMGQATISCTLKTHSYTEYTQFFTHCTPFFASFFLLLLCDSVVPFQNNFQYCVFSNSYHYAYCCSYAINCHDKSTGRAIINVSVLLKCGFCLSNPSFKFKCWLWCSFIFTSARKVWQTLSLFCVSDPMAANTSAHMEGAAQTSEKCHCMANGWSTKAQKQLNNTREQLQVKRWNCHLQYEYNISVFWRSLGTWTVDEEGNDRHP